MRLDGSCPCHAGVTDVRPAERLRDAIGDTRESRYLSWCALQCAAGRATLALSHMGWHPSRARDDITGSLFVRARINNLFDEDDELA